MNKPLERLQNGLIKENPTFVLMLGMCPTLAVTTSAINGLGMGLSTTVVLALSNLMISLLRNIIPDRVRMPAYIVVVASFVTIVQFLVQGFVPSLYDALGIYIPLIVVNCIILGRAESYASKNPSLTVIGIVREFLGAGTIFDHQVLPLADRAAGKAGYTPISIFIMAPGAFFILAILVAVMKEVRKSLFEKTGKKLAPAESVLGEDCAVCPFAASCSGKSVLEAKKAETANSAAPVKSTAGKESDS